MMLATNVNTPRLKTKLRPILGSLFVLSVQITVSDSTNSIRSVMMLKTVLAKTSCFQLMTWVGVMDLSHAARTGSTPKASTKTVGME